jgi:hypothetical protein
MPVEVAVFAEVAAVVALLLTIAVWPAVQNVELISRQMMNTLNCFILSINK